MTKTQIGFISFLLLIGLIFSGCRTEPKATPPTTSPKPKTSKPTVRVPSFDANQAYDYIQKQVDFGPRVPGTSQHKECADWLKAELEKFANKVMVQTAQVTAYNGKKLPMYNIIGSFNPKASKRVLLCAHWDTRPIADQDTKNQNQPILGANDGGSGVGVLLEVARQLAASPVKIGVDIIFFDVEDYGESNTRDSYCLGSQYWGKNPHVPNYKAEFGILLDMVGAKNAVFYQEGNSKKFAGNVVKKVWDKANAIGYSSYFPYESVAEVTDDHLYINKLAKIPTIDIIQYDNYNGFGDFWHTHDDNMKVINRSTLKAVGQTILAVLYSE